MLNPQYEAWNAALIREYMPEDASESLAVFPVDQDELRVMATAYDLCDPEEAVEHFRGAVLSEIPLQNFTVWSRRVPGWRDTDRDEPHYIAVLAFCVLAAMRMESDATARISSTNYYVQLNRLLDRADDLGQPNGFDRMGRVWEDLKRWLEVDCAGNRGRSTIRTHPKWRHIGYPLSQALLRAQDRRRLPDFFRVTGLEPGSDISADRLFTLLRAWAARPGCGLTNRGRQAIASAQDTDLHEIAETVQRELAAWDGELRDDRGRKRAALNLLLIPRGRRRGLAVRLVGRRPPEFPVGDWQVEGSPAVHALSAHVSEGWFAPLDLPVSEQALHSGLKLVNGGYALSYEPATAIPCGEAPIELGGYASRPVATMWEPHIAVVQHSALSDLQSFLRPYVDAPLRTIGGKSDLPANWAAIEPFRLTSVPRNPPRSLERFAPRLLSTMRLEGGLPLKPGVYLTKGEPDATVSVADGQELEVRIDEEVQTLRQGACILELSAMDLTPGEHEIAADVTRRFSTVETFGDMSSPGTGSFGHRLFRHSHYQPSAEDAEELPSKEPPTGGVFVSGAMAFAAQDDLPLESHRPVLAPAGRKRYIVIGARPGQLITVPAPPPPGWIQSLGLGAQFTDIQVTFEAVWLLTEAKDGAKAVWAATEASPESPAEREPAEEWCTAILEWHAAEVHGPHDELWAAYAEAANLRAFER